MKSPIGFNGTALWALVALLVLGVAWIQSNTNFQTAAYAIIAVGGALFLIIGFLLALAAKRITMAGIIDFKKAEAQIERERERNRREEMKADNRLEARAMQVGTVLARQLFGAWRAQQEAEQAAQRQPDSPFTVDLDETEYQYSEDEL